MPRDQMIPRENLRIGDRVKAYLLRVDRQSTRAAVDPFADGAAGSSSSCSKWKCRKLMTGWRDQRRRRVIQGYGQRLPSSPMTSASIRSVPVSVCAACAVTAVTGWLAGERVDIVLWSPDPAQFVVGALAPPKVSSVVVDESTAWTWWLMKPIWRSPSVAVDRMFALASENDRLDDQPGDRRRCRPRSKLNRRRSECCSWKSSMSMRKWPIS